MVQPDLALSIILVWCHALLLGSCLGWLGFGRVVFRWCLSETESSTTTAGSQPILVCLTVSVGLVLVASVSLFAPPLQIWMDLLLLALACLWLVLLQYSTLVVHRLGRPVVGPGPSAGTGSWCSAMGLVVESILLGLGSVGSLVLAQSSDRHAIVWLWEVCLLSLAWLAWAGLARKVLSFYCVFHPRRSVHLQQRHHALEPLPVSTDPVVLSPSERRLHRGLRRAVQSSGVVMTLLLVFTVTVANLLQNHWQAPYHPWQRDNSLLSQRVQRGHLLLYGALNATLWAALALRRANQGLCPAIASQSETPVNAQHGSWVRLPDVGLAQGALCDLEKSGVDQPPPPGPETVGPVPG